MTHPTPIIYKLTCKVNGKSYIGQTRMTLKERLRHHQRILTGIGGALRKYGIKSFEIEILHECHDSCLNAWEQIEILRYQTLAPNGYNLKTGGDGGKILKETREKLRRIQTGKKHSKETRLKISQGNKGKKVSMETRQKMSKAREGRKFNPLTEQHRLKISKANAGKLRSIETREKMSKTKRHPKYDEVYNFYVSLPTYMEVKEKRKIVVAKFSDIKYATIWKWIKKWQRE